MVKKRSGTAAAPSFMDFFHNNVMLLNNSKFFAGVVIISLNIASKFVTIRLSKTTETYLKYTFSWQLLIFAMAWMASRDIYTAIALTVFFILLTQFLFNEESMFCVFPATFKEKYMNMAGEPAAADSGAPSKDEINKAIEILEKIKAAAPATAQPRVGQPITQM